MANSIAWSTAAVVVLGICGMRVFGREVGLLAALLLALSPAALVYSDQVRMYSMATVLIIWCWYAQVRWIGQGAGRHGLIALIASQFCLIYTHSAALVMLSGPVLFGFVTLLRSGRRNSLLRWLVAEVSVAVLALPAVGIALFRQVEHTRRPDLADAMSTWSFLVTGHSGLGIAFVAISILVAGALIAAAVYDKELRVPIATLIFAPLVLAALVSYVLKPIWLERTFLSIVPFICLMLAAAVVRFAARDGLSAGWLRSAAAALVIALAGLSVTQQLTRSKGDGFRAAASRIESLAKPGDVVLVDGHFSYWSFLWYFAGPDWGLPQHAFIMQPKWARAMEKVPATVAGWLDLNQSQSTVDHKGVAVKLWDRAEPITASGRDVIVVRLAGDPSVEIAGMPHMTSFTEQNIAIDRYTR
jgi:uncharacterized membrane protein